MKGRRERGTTKNTNRLASVDIWMLGHRDAESQWWALLKMLRRSTMMPLWAYSSAFCLVFLSRFLVSSSVHASGHEEPHVQVGSTNAGGVTLRSHFTISDSLVPFFAPIPLGRSRALWFFRRVRTLSPSTPHVGPVNPFGDCHSDRLPVRASFRGTPDRNCDGARVCDPAFVRDRIFGAGDRWRRERRWAGPVAGNLSRLTPGAGAPPAPGPFPTEAAGGATFGDSWGARGALLLFLHIRPDNIFAALFSCYLKVCWWLILDEFWTRRKGIGKILLVQNIRHFSINFFLSKAHISLVH